MLKSLLIASTLIASTIIPARADILIPSGSYEKVSYSSCDAASKEVAEMATTAASIKKLFGADINRFEEAQEHFENNCEDSLANIYFSLVDSAHTNLLDSIH